MPQFLPNLAFRDKKLFVNQTEAMRKKIGQITAPGLPALPAFGALGLMTLGAGLTLGLGLGLGLCIGIFAEASKPRAAPKPEPDELSDLRAERAHHAERVSQLDHDLRTPIGTVVTALEWMNTTLDEPESQAEARQVIGRQVRKMIALTEELHQLAEQLRS